VHRHRPRLCGPIIGHMHQTSASKIGSHSCLMQPQNCRTISSTAWYVTLPIFSKISNGPLYLHLSFWLPFLLTVVCWCKEVSGKPNPLQKTSFLTLSTATCTQYRPRLRASNIGHGYMHLASVVAMYACKMTIGTHGRIQDFNQG
jgi:hypothetical protein